MMIYLSFAAWMLASCIWMIAQDVQIEKMRKRIKELEDAERNAVS